MHAEGIRAQSAIRSLLGFDAAVEPLAAGQSSQAWKAVGADGEWVVRVPVLHSGRLLGFRSEALIGRLLAEAGHSVATWQIVSVDDVDCSLAPLLPGSPVDADWSWSTNYAEQLSAVLRDLHQLPVTGWGALENRDDRLHGSSPDATQGIVDRWFHAAIWPFDGSQLVDHPLADSAGCDDLLPTLTGLKQQILDAASGPFGAVHSDLHRQHLLHIGDQLSGLLDFGDAFVGSTAWDFALLLWYYGFDNMRRVATAYGDTTDLAERGALLAVAVGCYKIAKNPDDPSLLPRLQTVLDAQATSAS